MNAKYLKRIILEEIRNVLNEGDEDVAKDMGARVRGEGEVGDAATDIAFRTIGMVVSYMVSKPDKATVANQAITELQQYMKNTQAKLGQFAQSAYGIVEKSTPEDKQYYFNISKQFQTGGLKAAQNYIQQYSGKEKAPEQSNQAKPTTTAEVTGDNIGSRTNPANDPMYLKNIAKQAPEVYKGKIGFYRFNNQLKQIQL